MRECALCGVQCDSSIGCARELKTDYWGGRRTGPAYSSKVVTFFCTEEHRNIFLEFGVAGGEIQTEKWEADREVDHEA